MASVPELIAEVAAARIATTTMSEIHSRVTIGQAESPTPNRKLAATLVRTLAIRRAALTPIQQDPKGTTKPNTVLGRTRSTPT